MRNARKWPRFVVSVEMEVCAPCAQAAEDLADEYATRARNDNGEDRVLYSNPALPAQMQPTEPAYVVSAEVRRPRVK